MLARDNENFCTSGENRTHDPPNTTCLSDIPTTEPEGREFDSFPGHGNFLCPGRAWFLRNLSSQYTISILKMS